MSIYATLWSLYFPRTGDEFPGCEWLMVTAQGVPPHIGCSAPGLGYENGDPYDAFLPPALPPHFAEHPSLLRAVVFVAPLTTKGTPRSGQEYEDPLLVLSGHSYMKTPFWKLHATLCDKLRGGRPRPTSHLYNGDGTVTIHFDDGSSRTVDSRTRAGFTPRLVPKNDPSGDGT